MRVSYLLLFCYECHVAVVVLLLFIAVAWVGLYASAHTVYVIRAFFKSSDSNLQYVLFSAYLRM